MITSALANDTVAVVLAGGRGTRLGALTRHVCKPALPFGAAYRNIDFSLSNCVNSGIHRIAVATQYKPEALLRHINEVWSDIAGSLIAAWPAEERAPISGYRGTADAVFRNLDEIDRAENRLALVLAGDHVYQMDYRPMLAYHRERGADVTVGCMEVPADEAKQFGIMSVDRQGRINRFVEKPKTADELPATGPVLASMGIYVFDTKFLASVLRRDAFSSRSTHDFGGDVLPSLIRKARVFAYPFRGDGNGSAYWRDVGTPTAYWRANLELLGASPSLRLDDPRWPLPAAHGVPKLTTCYADSSREPDAARSLVSEDCYVAGTLRRSVLFSSVHVAPGALVEDTVVLPGAVIGRNCRLRGAIVESGCRIPDGMVIDQRFGGAGDGQGEPVLVTGDDLALDRACSIA